MRRTVLFYLVLAALVMLAAGVAVLDSLLMGHPILFLLYWGACLWLTLTCLLLALYDMFALRAEARRERLRLKSKILGQKDEEKPS